jgi:uncharacterized phiE125 gp8 family phage protein
MHIELMQRRLAAPFRPSGVVGVRPGQTKSDLSEFSMMLVEETTVPAMALPIAQFKDHLRLGSGFADDDLQDGLLESHLRAAIAAIEARTGKILIARDFNWTLHAWRDAYRQPLPIAPVAAISGVTLIDRFGVETIAPTTGWKLEVDAHRPRLLGLNGPLLLIPQDGSVRIGMVAGFGSEWSDLPNDLAQAAFLLAAHFYEFRHATTGSVGNIPLGVAALIAPHRNVRLFTGGRS